MPGRTGGLFVQYKELRKSQGTNSRGGIKHWTLTAKGGGWEKKEEGHGSLKQKNMRSYGLLRCTVYPDECRRLQRRDKIPYGEM